MNNNNNNNNNNSNNNNVNNNVNNNNGNIEEPTWEGFEKRPIPDVPAGMKIPENSTYPLNPTNITHIQ